MVCTKNVLKWQPNFRAPYGIKILAKHWFSIFDAKMKLINFLKNSQLQWSWKLWKTLGKY